MSRFARKAVIFVEHYLFVANISLTCNCDLSILIVNESKFLSNKGGARLGRKTIGKRCISTLIAMDDTLRKLRAICYHFGNSIVWRL